MGLVLADQPEGPLVYASHRVSASDQPLPSLKRGESGDPELVLPSSPSLSLLLAHLQYVESLGSLLLGIERVNWRDYRQEWIPENPDEERLAITPQRKTH